MKVIKHKDKWYLQSETGYKEILLSTDDLLIKDGVQAINDEFLEWLVKNPSCEWVEVEIKPMFPMYSTFIESIDNPPFYGNLKRKIIIPKEKPKQPLQKLVDEGYGDNIVIKDDMTYEFKPKQETLEEASLLSRPIHLIWDEDERYDCNEEFREEFKKGAKWQQETSYSEEDMEISFEAGRNYEEFIQSQKANLDWEGKIDYKPKSFIEWFEQFKKK